MCVEVEGMDVVRADSGVTARVNRSLMNGYRVVSSSGIFSSDRASTHIL